MKTGFPRRYYHRSGSWRKKRLCSITFDTDSGMEYEVKFWVNASHDTNADTDADGNRGHTVDDVECDGIKSLDAVVHDKSIRSFNTDKLPKRLEEAMDEAIDKYIDDGECMDDFAAADEDAKLRAYEMRNDI